jgi:hypothetical protein
MDFLKIIQELTKASNLHLSDICVMAVLVTYAQYEPEQTIEISATKIHSEFERLNLRTIKKSLQHLTELHYIETIKQAAPKPNKYKVLIPIPAAQPKQIYQKKNTNKYNADDEYIAEAVQAMRKNPFMQ